MAESKCKNPHAESGTIVGKLPEALFRFLSENHIDTDVYKRQMEVYQWLLRQLGFKVAATGYFVYCNGRADAKAFDGKVEFDVVLLPYEGKDGWIEGTLEKLKECLDTANPPEPSDDCEFCGYAQARKSI